MTDLVVLGRNWHDDRLPECPTCPEYLKKIAGETCDARCVKDAAAAHYARSGAGLTLTFRGRTYVKVAIGKVRPLRYRTNTVALGAPRSDLDDVEVVKRDEVTLWSEFLDARRSRVLERYLDAWFYCPVIERLSIHNLTEETVEVIVFGTGPAFEVPDASIG